jgi:flagellar protein FliL
MRSIDHKAIFLLALLLGLSPSFGYAGGHGGGGEEKGGAAFPGYVPLTPPLVVNLANKNRAQFLRVDIQFFVETAQDAEALATYMPLLRDRMITLLGGRQADQLMSVQAREQLRAELLAKLRETMTEKAGIPAITAIYFTGFIIQ